MDKSFETEAGSTRVIITVDGLSPGAPVSVPVRCGVPLPKGRISDPSQIVLLDGAGRRVPFQPVVTGYWQDKSLKWVNLGFLADAADYVAEIGTGNGEAIDGSHIVSDESEEAITVTTGPLKLEIPKGGTTFFPGRVWIDRDGDGVFSDADLVTKGGPLWVRLEGDTDGTFQARTDCAKLETAGPQRATVRLEGHYVHDDGAEVDRWVVRIHAYAGCDFLTVQHSFMNTVDVRSTHTMAVGLGFTVPDATVAAVELGIEGENVSVNPSAVLSVVQMNAQTPTFPKFDQFEPVCRVTADGETVAQGAKSDGWMSVQSAGGAVTVGLRDIWQKHPGGFDVDAVRKTVAVMIVPEIGKPYDWKAGRKSEMTARTGSPWGSFGDDGIGFTDELIIGFGGDTGVEQARAKAFCAIPHALVDPNWLEHTRALGHLPACDRDAFPEAERQLDRMVEWLWRHAHEYFHWYGITWGGIQTHYQPRSGHWSDLTERYGWLNAEADTNAGVLQHYVRTGSRRAFLLGRSMLRHDQDVGTSHRSGYGRRHYVYAWGQGGDWPHTFLFAPSIYYHLTACERTRDFIEMTAGVTEAAITEGSLMRDTHNVIRCALWLYETTGDETWKRKGEAIMNNTLVLQEAGGLFGKSGLMTNIYLLKAMDLYDRTIGDNKVRQALTRCMDANITMPGRLEMSKYVHKNGEGLAQAYRYSGGDKSYLWSGLRDLTTIRWDSIYERYDPILRFPRCGYDIPGPDGDVRHDTFVSTHNAGHKLTKIPYLMWAARDAGLTEAVFSKVIDTGQVGVFMPGIRRPEEVRWTDFETLRLPGCNTAPLAKDPFGLDCDLNMSGLPWGCMVAFGSVPFSLQPATRETDNAVICLAAGESVRIPVAIAALSLHFLGQVVAYAGLEYDRLVGKYVVEFDDGSAEEVEWRNVRNCEAFGLEHVALAAPLAQAWAPHLFDAGSTVLVHINSLRVDTGGRVVRSVRLEAGDTDARPVLLAVTAERTEAAPANERATQVRFDLEDDTVRVEPADGFMRENGYLESRGDVSEGTIRIPVAEPGAYRVEAVMESTQPLLVDISDGNGTVVQGWQLLGEWPTGRSIQPIAFDASTPEDLPELALCIYAGRGTACYHCEEGGGNSWSLGWVYDPRLERWAILREEYLPAMEEEPVQSVEKPKDDGSIAEVWYRRREKWLPADDTETLFGPKWRIHEIVVRKLIP
jgi:hypothetical protein